MSRVLQSSTLLKATLGSAWTVGAAPKTIFAWINVGDWGGGTSVDNNLFGFLDSGNAADVRISSDREAVGTDSCTLINAGDSTGKQLFTENVYDSVWVPIMAVFDSSADYWALFIDADTTGASRAGAPAANAVTQLFVGNGNAQARSFKIAHLTYWDVALTAANFTTLTTPDPTNSPNPSVAFPSNLLAYWSFDTDTLTADEGSDATVATLAESGTGSSYDGADDPLVDAYTSASGPTFTLVDDIENKVGDVISEDINDWYTASLGSLDTFAEVGTTLPAAAGEPTGRLTVNPTTGIISGTLTNSAGTVAVDITASDDNGATIGEFNWVITNYELIFTGTKKLLTTSGSAYSGSVNFSAVLGTIDGGLSTVVEFGTETVTAGEVTLNSASLTAGTWTVFAQDDADTTILGVYEMVAE